MIKINGRVCLSDLRSISHREFNTACGIYEKIRKIKESRISYVKAHGLEPDIALPAGVWAKGSADPMSEPWGLLATPTYDIINNLRLYTQSFTGYQLMSFSISCPKPMLQSIPDNFDEEIEKIASKPDCWVYRYIAITECLPAEIIAKPPKILGEIGWDVDGRVVNHDTYVCQERLNLLYEAGIIDWLRKKAKSNISVNILEIGAGYGGLAYHLKHIVPELNYYICDIPEALLFSALYLAITCPDCQHTIYDGIDKATRYKSDPGFKFIPNFMFEDLLSANIKIDLAINTLSFPEMSEKQVRYYAQNLSNMLGAIGVLFEQNHLDPINHKLYLSKYFKFRKTIKPMSIPVLTQGVADIWTNKPVSDMSRHRVKKWIFTKCFGIGLRWWLSFYDSPRSRLEAKFPALVRFIPTRSRLRSFLGRLLRKLGGIKCE